MSGSRQRARAPRPVEKAPDRWRVGWPAACAALFLLALALRLLFQARVSHSPFVDSLNADSRIYWEWAGLLRAGDWWGRNPFFLGPLYPYTLAVLRSLVGDSVHAVLVAQAFWGSVAVVLLADAARRLAGPLAGIAAGVLLAGYRMAVFSDGLILMESLLFVLESLLLWLVVSGDWRAARAWRLAGLGLLVGLLAQGRATSLLLVVPAALIVWGAAPTWRQAARRLALVAVTLAAVCVPTTLRNRAVSGEWIPFTYSLGYNLYVGCNPEATGSFVNITGTMEPFQGTGGEIEGGVGGDGREYLRDTYGLALSPTQSSRHWTAQARDWYMRDPLGGTLLMLKKLGMAWSRHEYPQIESLDVFDAVAGPIGIPWAGTFALLGALALAGCAGAWRRGGPGRFVLGYVAVTTLGLAVFFVTDRYRLHLVPGAALLASVGLTDLAAGLREGARRPLVGAAAGLLAGVAVVSLPMPSLDPARRAWDTASDIGARWLEKGRPDLALPELEKAVAIDLSGRLPPSRGATARMARAAVHVSYGIALRQIGRDEQAVAPLERAYELAPERPEALTLAEAYAVTGRLRQASALYENCQVSPQQASADLLRRAWQAAHDGRMPEVEPLLRASTGLDSANVPAWVGLVRLQAQAARFGDAMQTLERARDAGLPGSVYYAYLAYVAALRGDLAGADAALAHLPTTADSDPLLADVVRFARWAVVRGGHGR